MTDIDQNPTGRFTQFAFAFSNTPTWMLEQACDELWHGYGSVGGTQPHQHFPEGAGDDYLKAEVGGGNNVPVELSCEVPFIGIDRVLSAICVPTLDSLGTGGARRRIYDLGSRFNKVLGTVAERDTFSGGLIQVVRSFFANEFVFEQKADSPLMLHVKGVGDKTIFDSIINTENALAALAYLTQRIITDKVMHWNAASQGGNFGGVYLRELGTGDTDFTEADRIYPSDWKCTINLHTKNPKSFPREILLPIVAKQPSIKFDFSFDEYGGISVDPNGILDRVLDEANTKGRGVPISNNAGPRVWIHKIKWESERAADDGSGDYFQESVEFQSPALALHVENPNAKNAGEIPLKISATALKALAALTAAIETTSPLRIITINADITTKCTQALSESDPVPAITASSSIPKFNDTLVSGTCTAPDGTMIRLYAQLVEPENGDPKSPFVQIADGFVSANTWSVGVTGLLKAGTRDPLTYGMVLHARSGDDSHLSSPSGDESVKHIAPVVGATAHTATTVSGTCNAGEAGARLTLEHVVGPTILGTVILTSSGAWSIAGLTLPAAGQSIRASIGDGVNKSPYSSNIVLS